MQLPPVASNQLRPLSAFAALEPEERSRALFVEASRVLLHPRCLNCHVSVDSPAQGDALALHEPPVTRGAEGKGVVGMECTSCHQETNLDHSRVPGAPGWHLPPVAMAWVGRSPRELCEQLTDPERNGHRTLDQIVHHSGHDALVGWGWQPGADRVPAPGTQAEFGALMAEWVSTGAVCPLEGERAPVAALEEPSHD